MIVTKNHLRIAAAAAWAIGSLASAPAVAQQPNGYPITNVNLRAGPGTEYPVIVTVPGRAPISILGCLPDYSWCDSLFQGNRGWMRSIYLSGYYQGNYYSLGDYAPRLGYRTVSFDIDGYWASNYRDRPFYGERTRWTRPREEGFVETGVFYNRLAPYGNWVWIQGQYVWVPSRVDRSWRPYTRGRWVFTDRGWTWVSNEPFGWATYHYGRWGFSNRVGWFWVPGSRWAPAWVSWRESDDYLAWAPMPPAYDGGINVNVAIGTVPDYYWQVVPSRSFLSDDLQGQIVYDRNRQRPILERSRALGNTTITNNNVVVNNVVNVTYVEEKTKKKVVERKIGRAKDAKAAGKVEGDVVEIFQPAAEVTLADLAPPEPKTIKEVAEESQTKGQAEGEATTEKMLVPPEIQKAQNKRKAAKPAKGETPKDEEPTAPASGAEPPLSPSLPKGGEASAPPPEGAAPAGAPVPAEDLTPAAAEAPPAAPPADTPPAAKGGEAPPPPPAAEAPPPADEVPAAPPAAQAPAPDVTPPPPVEDQAPVKAKEKGTKPKKEAQPEGPAPTKPLPQDEAPPPPPPALKEMAPPPPPPAPPPLEESKPNPSEGKAREDKSKKAKDKSAKPSGEPVMEQTAPPPPPPPPPMEEPAPQPKKEGKGKNGNGGPPPPDGESGKKAKTGKKHEGAPPCPEGTVPLEDGSCAPMQ